MKSDTLEHYWDYLSPHQRDLIREGSYIYQEIFSDGKYSFQDYSFIVFPFAKAFEGFIKQFLLDIGAINYQQYNSDHIRVGRLLSPEVSHFTQHDSVYEKIGRIFGLDMANTIWMTWKFCRNQVFHYYPHNSRLLTLNEARERIHLILSTIKTCHEALKNKTLCKQSSLDYQDSPNSH